MCLSEGPYIKLSPVQKRDQARRIPPLAAHFLDFRVELVDQRRDREVGAVAACLGETNSEVLAHPVHGEAEVELAGRHGLVTVFHLPGLRRSLGDGGDQLLDIEVGALGKMQRLGESLHEPGDADLVTHLGELAGAGGAHQVAGTRIGRDNLFSSPKWLRVAAAHHGERAVFRSGLATRHRGINGIEAALAGGGIEFAGDLGGCGRVIDEHRAFCNAMKGAIRPEHNLAHIVVVADAGHDEILTLGGGPRGRRGTPAELGHPLLGLGGGAIVDCNVVTTLDLEMTGHRIAHHAKSEKRNLCHEAPPCGRKRPNLSIPSLLSRDQWRKMGSLMRCYPCRRQPGHLVDRHARAPILCLDIPTREAWLATARESLMALTKSDVLASLEGVAGPGGIALPKTGTLSDIVVSDGKVFFSVTVDAAAVNAWEPVRRRAEAAVKALPGVTSVMVALTAERGAGSARPQGATSQ